MNRILLALAVPMLLAPPAGAAETVREQSERELDAGGIASIAVENPRGRVQVSPDPAGHIRVTALKIVRAHDAETAQKFARETKVSLSTQGGKCRIMVQYPQNQEVRVGLWQMMAGDFDFPGVEVRLAKRAVAVVSEQQPKQLMLGLKHMGELALGQLKEVLDAFIERDADRALKVWYKDEEIDAMYNSLFRELLTYMMEDPRNISVCIHLLFCAKNIERMGDHATNIAETVHYIIEGRPIADQRPKGDTTTIAAVRTAAER